MPIPGKFERDMAKVEDAAGLVMIRLRQMHFSPPYPGMRAQLREAVMAYAELVMKSAPDG